jgi:YD repeat-containing protein
MGSRVAGSRLGRSILAVAMIAVATGIAAAGAAAQPGQPGYLTYRTIPLGTANPIGVGVDVASGNLIITEQDLVPSAASYEVEVDRTYNSQAAVPGVADGALGPRWTFDVGVQTRVTYSGTTATVYGPDGYVQQLTGALGDTFVGPADYDGVLTHNPDGTSTLVRAEDTLNFNSGGQLASVTNANGTFTVADTSAAGHTVLSSYGTASGRRANFSYEGTPRVRQFQDPASADHEYLYDWAGRLAEVRQPDGSSVAYEYDAHEYLSKITSEPDGTVVSFVNDEAGRVLSLTVAEPGEEEETTTFSYGEGSTVVTEPYGNGVEYTYESEGRVTSVSSSETEGPEAFTCVPQTPDEPEFVEPEEVEEEETGLAPEATVCPPGQQKEPVGWEGIPDEAPEFTPPPAEGSEGEEEEASPAPPPAASKQGYYYEGWRRIFSSGFDSEGGTFKGTPTDGGFARMTVAAPDVPKDPAGGESNHSLAEIALTEEEAKVNYNQIEFGWIVAPERGGGLPGSPRPRLFVFDWINGKKQGYNGEGCEAFGRIHRRIQKGALLKGTGGATRRFSVRHDEAKHRWEVYYAGRPMCAFKDSLWKGNFTSARTVSWYGEVTKYSNGEYCEQMGNGRFGTAAGAAKIDDMNGFGGSSSYSFLKFENKPVHDKNYAGVRDGNDARYGGPGDSCG